MKRREFISLSLPATGAILLTPGCIYNSTVLNEINQQFSGKSTFDQYDIVINGAGLYGYFAALNAARRGKKVLVVEKRTSPGYEITAKKRLWLGATGFDNFRPELTELFLPEGEKREIHNKTGKGINSSFFGDEILLYSGSIRKGMLRNLLINKVHVLLMTDVCGLFSDNDNVKGVLLAGKHGIHIVKCRSFIDASDNILFSRELLGNKYKIKTAGFVTELRRVKNVLKKEVKVAGEFGLLNDIIRLHPGKNTDDQSYMEYLFHVNTEEPGDIEHHARLILAKLGSKLHGLDDSLKSARINEFAHECSVHLEDMILPAPFLKGHYMFPNAPDELSCLKILDIEAEAEKIVDNIKYSNTKPNIATLFIPGAQIPYNEISVTDPDEPGLSIPLKSCRFDYESQVKFKQNCQVLVAGGGTSGAMAAWGACEKGAGTVVIDYFNDLGGTRTMGGVMGYYYGMREPEIFKKQDEENIRVANEANMTKKSGSKIHLLQEILGKGGRFIPGALMCDSLVNNNIVEGVVICRNGRLELIKGEITIDGTGDGDIACFAGAGYEHGNSRTGKTQNYSQRDISGGVRSYSNTARDYDIIDNTKISELQRGLFLSHYKAHFYDFHPMLTVRESRRIKGLYTLDMIDAAEGTRFRDIISMARSDFDPHYTGNSEFTRCGFLLPHSNMLIVEIPYRAIIPRNLGGLLISGKGISQTQNYMQFTRMCPDLLVLGYLTGQIAAELARYKQKQPGDYDISGLQGEWAERGDLPKDYATRRIGNLTGDTKEINRRVHHLSQGREEYLYECIRLPKEKALPLLLKNFNDTGSEDSRLLLAKALAWFGDKTGNDLIEKELNKMFDKELEEGYPGGYIEKYDYIRGREKNVLEGLFWRINQNIALLGMAGNDKINNSIRNLIENTTSGGKMVKWTLDHNESRSVNGVHTIVDINAARVEYFNGRIDLRLIPFHNRIFNLCFYVERVADPIFIPGLEKLLDDENIKGYITKDYHLTMMRIYGGDLELFIAAALARCGSKTGYNMLVEYLNDIHYNFKQFALSELRDLTKKEYGYDPEEWKGFMESTTFPRSCRSRVTELEL